MFFSPISIHGIVTEYVFSSPIIARLVLFLVDKGMPTSSLRQFKNRLCIGTGHAIYQEMSFIDAYSYRLNGYIDTHT
jgi:hypothetical protein